MNGLLSWLAPKPRGLLAQDDPNAVDLDGLPNSNGGSFMSGLLGAAQSGFTLPGDVATGKVNPLSDEGIARTQDMAGLAMTGGFAGAPKQAGEAVVGSGPIRAYHGSPHDFDRFDLSKIGTGEGAQAYGHGLYFAENEATAKAYRDTLSPVVFGGQQVQTLDAPWRARDALRWIADGNSGVSSVGEGAARLRATGDDFAKQASAMKGSAFESERTRLQALAKEHFDAADWLKANDTTAPVKSGRMYEVAIHADPKQFLDWDLPLINQGRASDAFLSTVPKEGGAREAAYRDTFGNKPIGHMMRYYADDPVATSAALNEAGIPGIKYLDQGSRTAGDGSRNYVTFSDKIVEIMRKYGVASFAALPPAVQMMLQNEQQPDQ